uniref:Uncharacterized protein n=1 Tax=Anguilla anguilla TaxID=7936 RepID=A0A0E9XUE1_ANGAN
MPSSLKFTAGLITKSISYLIIVYYSQATKWHGMTNITFSDCKNKK